MNTNMNFKDYYVEDNLGFKRGLKRQEPICIMYLRIINNKPSKGCSAQCVAQPCYQYSKKKKKSRFQKCFFINF